MSSLKAKAIFDTAIAQMHEQNFADAIELLKKALHEEANFPEAVYNLACCHAVLKKRADALQYLDRAIKLDIACMDWAREDVEFSSMRDDADFKEVIARNDPVRKPSIGRDGKLEDESKSRTGGSRAAQVAPSVQEASAGPICPKCGQLLLEQYLSVVSQQLVWAIAFFGVVLALLLFDKMIGLFGGILILILGLVLNHVKYHAWVCQGCGAVQLEEPPPPPKKPKPPAPPPELDFDFDEPEETAPPTNEEQPEEQMAPPGYVQSPTDPMDLTEDLVSLVELEQKLPKKTARPSEVRRAANSGLTP